MTNQDLTDLAHANLKEYREEIEPDEVYSTSNMLAFHKQGIREGLNLALEYIKKEGRLYGDLKKGWDVAITQDEFTSQFKALL